MTKKAFSRNVTLAAGVLAAVVILISQAFRQEACTYLSRIDKEKTEASGGEHKTYVVAASDAVPSAQAAEKTDTGPSLIREIVTDDGNSQTVPVAAQTVLTTFFKTLFHAIISPQAP